MCIKRYDYDEAILCVRPHAPHAAATIEAYVEQLERDKANLPPDWHRAYTLLFDTNERHIAELKTANTIISALQTKVDNLRRVIKRAQIPVCPTCEMDDDALEPV